MVVRMLSPLVDFCVVFQFCLYSVSFYSVLFVTIFRLPTHENTNSDL
jgi:hypothetical protein